jgi:hypothetical protein
VGKNGPSKVLELARGIIQEELFKRNYLREIIQEELFKGNYSR